MLPALVIQSAFPRLLQRPFKAVARFVHGLFLDLKEDKIFSSVKVKGRLFCIYSREEKPVETCCWVGFFFFLLKLPGARAGALLTGKSFTSMVEIYLCEATAPLLSQQSAYQRQYFML